MDIVIKNYVYRQHTPSFLKNIKIGWLNNILVPIICKVKKTILKNCEIVSPDSIEGSETEINYTIEFENEQGKDYPVVS